MASLYGVLLINIDIIGEKNRLNYTNLNLFDDLWWYGLFTVFLTCIVRKEYTHVGRQGFCNIL